MPIDRDPSHIHPVMREKSAALDKALAAAGIPLALYEGGRSPQRQAALYSKGRGQDGFGVGAPLRHVTNARAWESKHQYGVAEDRVFFVDGAWSWAEPEKGMWARYQELAHGLGLVTLSFEKPHVELDVSLGSLRAGHYPVPGDDSWSDWLESMIEAWGPGERSVGGLIHPGAPPLMIERPSLVA